MINKLTFGGLFILSCTFASAQQLARVQEKGLVGFINKDGSFQITPQFKNAHDQSEGKIAVYDGSRWGFVDKDANYIIQPQYVNAKSFSQGMAMVKSASGWLYIDSLGQELKSISSKRVYEFNDGVAFYRDATNLVGLINNKQEVVLPPTYDVIRPFKDGYAKVAKNKKWGVIDNQGKEVIAPNYDDIGDFNVGLVWAKKQNNWFLVSGQKEIALPGISKIDHIENADFILVQQGNKVGFIDSDGKWLIPATYDDARNFQEGLAPVKLNGKWGYIDTTGKMIIPTAYQDALSFSPEGLAAVKDSKWGFIDKNAKVIIPFQYEITAALTFKKQEKGFIDGLARVKLNGKWGFIDTKGNLLGNKWFDNAELFQN